MSTEALLAERKKTHGDYREHASCTQSTMDLWRAERNYDRLTVCQKESLHMFAHKVGRILTGNPDVEDHWADIAGYATLIVQELQRSKQEALARKLFSQREDSNRHAFQETEHDGA